MMLTKITKRHTWLKSTFLVFLLLFSIAGGYASNTSSNTPKEKNHYVFGLLPFMSPLALYKRFSPLRDYLNKHMDKEVVIESSPNFSEHLKAIRNRKYDFVLTAPHFVIPATENGPYRVVATYTKPLSAVVITHRNSKIQNLQQLNGYTISTPPPKAIITIVGKKLLADQHQSATDNRKKGQHKFVSYPSHNSAYHAVLAGESKAAVVAVYVYLGALKAKKPLRLIGKSHEFPAVGILAAKDVPEATVKRFLKTLTSMRRTPDGRSALRRMSFPGYRKATMSDYEVLREIKIPAAKHQPFHKKQ
jgi:phosphonate transport system substrate-binding protein